MCDTTDWLHPLTPEPGRVHHICMTARKLELPTSTSLKHKIQLLEVHSSRELSPVKELPFLFFKSVLFLHQQHLSWKKEMRRGCFHPPAKWRQGRNFIRGSLLAALPCRAFWVWHSHSWALGSPCIRAILCVSGPQRISPSKGLLIHLLWPLYFLSSSACNKESLRRKTTPAHVCFDVLSV